MRDEFQDFWQANFPDCPPVSFLFEQNLNDRWFRVQTLPCSKRYADGPDDVRESMVRQKKLFEDLIGKEEKCFIVCGEFLKSLKISFHKRFRIKLLTQDSEPIPRRTFDPNAKRSEIFQVCFGKHLSRFRKVERIFIDLSYQDIAYFFVLNENSKRIYAPYGGGVDVILENSAKRDEFKEKYKNWLSPRLGRIEETRKLFK